MKDSKSCLVLKFENFIALSDLDRQLIAEIEKSPREFPAHDHFRHSDEENSDIYVIKEGWVYSYAVLPDGRRQVFQVYVPGDIVGLYDAPLQVATYDLQTATKAVLCPFPKTALEPIFRQSPSLTALLFSLAMVDQAVLLDRVRSIGRMNARDRIAHFLLTVWSRLKLTNRELDHSFHLPLTQADIGDAIGLSNVTVSNVLSELESMGVARWRNKSVTLLDVYRLLDHTGFANRYDRLDVSWFPGAVARNSHS